MDNYRFPYEKPRLQYWTKESLNAIEATMSGGGGSGTGFGFTYQWETTPRISATSSIDFLTLGIEGAVAAIVAVATKNAEASIKIAGKAASAVAREIVRLGAEVIYYRASEYYLKAIPKNSAGVPIVCGTAVLTEYYSDSALTVQVSEPTKYAQVSSELEFMLDSCPIL